jgi:hypothetical protein
MSFVRRRYAESRQGKNNGAIFGELLWTYNDDVVYYEVHLTIVVNSTEWIGIPIAGGTAGPPTCHIVFQRAITTQRRVIRITVYAASGKKYPGASYEGIKPRLAQKHS